jgi:hypothetical protein
MMLDLFNKSGKNDVLLPSAYSDTTKSTNPIYGPALTVLGECTPESFYDALGVGAVVDGTLPRQQIVEYLGDRPNANHNPFFAPPTELVNGWANLAAACLQSAGKVNEIAQDPDAKAVLEAFNLDIDQGIRASRDNMVREIGTRAHFRALRLAGLLAVSRDFKNPVVSADDALWACWFVRRGINSLQTRFSDGDVGGGDTKREAEIRRTIREWFTLSKAQRVKYRATPKMIEGGGVPEYYLRKVRQLPCFRDHRNGENFAFRDALKNMDAAEELVCFPSQAAKEHWDTRSTVYSRGPNFTM